MKSLVRKELSEALVPALLLFVPLCVVWVAALNARDVLMNPQEDAAISALATAGFAGLLIGYCQFSSERWRKTLGYALHRGTSDGHVFVAKLIAGLVATALLAIGPPIVFTLVHQVISSGEFVFQYQRIVELAWLSASGVGTYALGTMVAQLHRAWWKEAGFALAACGALTIVTISSTVMTVDDPAPHALRYVVIQMAIAGVLLAVAFRLFTQRGDSDLPLPAAPHVALGLLGIILFVLPLDLGAAAAESEWIQEIRRSYPILLRDRATGRVLAAARNDRGEFREVDASGEIVPSGTAALWSGEGGWEGENSPYDVVHYPMTRPESVADDPLEPPRGAAILNGRWSYLNFMNSPVATVSAANGEFVVQGFLDLHAGVVRVFFSEFHPRKAPVARPDLVLPGGLPMALAIERPEPYGKFSSHSVAVFPPTQRVPWTGEEPSVYTTPCVVDARDRTMWRIDPLDLREPAREVTLPGGDRFVKIAGRSGPGYVTAPYAQYVEGERGRYAWNGTGFEAVEREAPAVAPTGDASKLVVLLNSSDPLEYVAEVRGADGSEVLYTYEYAPRGAYANARLALIYLTNVVRSPLRAVTSYFRTSADARARDATSGWAAVLLYDQQRPLLLLVVLVVAALLTRQVIRTLVRRGASRGTIGVWAILTAVLGAYAYLLFRILEPRGLPTRVVGTTASPAPLLIESHAPNGAQAAGSI